MRMRQSLAQLEEAFSQEIHLERVRRHSLRHTASERSRHRRLARQHKHGSVRFMLLAMAIVATAIVVTVVMFETLYAVMG